MLWLNIPKCPNCNAEIKIQAKFCPYCGYKLEESQKNTKEDKLNIKLITCPSCGEKINDNSDICPVCCEKVTPINNSIKEQVSINIKTKQMEPNVVNSNTTNNIPVQSQNHETIQTNNVKENTFINKVLNSKSDDNSISLKYLIFIILLIVCSLIGHLLLTASRY